MISQEDYERLVQMMADKGVRHEAFELLADMMQYIRRQDGRKSTTSAQ